MAHSKRPRRVNYSVNKKGPVSGGKVGKAITHYISLLKRTEIEGETLWLKNAFNIVEVKLKKYGINSNKLKNA
ncbi:MAG: hypothetical protein Q9M94_03605 [Candidatus Gracilibacteria bacterium]|nr:hypothetical protein [Candidatus Gracilibacteria bacterium]